MEDIKYAFQYYHPDDIMAADIIQELELRVHKRYRVLPITSFKAYEEVEISGQVVRLLHRVFCVVADSPTTVPSEVPIVLARQLMELTWSDIVDTIPAGDLVAWRRRPAFDGNILEETCKCCGAVSMTKQIKLTCRLGSTAVLETDASHKEGESIKIFNPISKGD